MGGKAEPGKWAYFLQKLSNTGYSEEEIRQKLSKVWVEPVFTKHPTEAKRWAVLGLHREIVRLLRKKDAVQTESEQNFCERSLEAVLERLWLTVKFLLKSPGLKNELQNLSYYLEQIFR